MDESRKTDFWTCGPWSGGTSDGAPVLMVENFNFEPYSPSSTPNNTLVVIFRAINTETHK